VINTLLKRVWLVLALLIGFPLILIACVVAGVVSGGSMLRDAISTWADVFRDP
jgi:hypothetical protein